MKKIRSLLGFAVILLLSACGQKEQTAAAAFQPPMEGVSWGMMPEEVMELLALPQESIESDDGTVVVLQCGEQSIFGQNADVKLTFDTTHQIGLLKMNIQFSAPSGDALVETLNEAYGEQGMAAGRDDPIRWESEKIEELPEEVQERFEFMLTQAFSKNEGPFSQESVWDMTKSQPLVTVTLRDENLNYYAGNMAVYLIYNDDAAYEAQRSELGVGED